MYPSLIDAPLPSAPPSPFIVSESLNIDHGLMVLGALGGERYRVLYDAAETGTIPNLRRLLELGVSPDYRINGKLPIHIATLKNRVIALDLLLRSDAEVNAIEKGGVTALHLAAEKGSLKMVNILIRYKADVKKKTASKESPLHYAVRSRNVDVVRALVTANADVNVRDTAQMTPLHRASQLGSSAIVKFLCESKANITCPYGRRVTGTALHLASDSGDLESVSFLLGAGAEVDAKDENDNTPLVWAVKRGHVDVVNWLLAHKADPNRVLQNKTTALHHAASMGEDIVGLLLSSKADVNVLSDSKSSPIHYAAKSGNEVVLRSLLAHDADPTEKNIEGKTALNYALEGKHDGIVRLLEDHIVKMPKKRGFFRG